MSELATNLKSLREAYGLTQQQLADYLETHRTQLAMYETAARKPPLGILTKLSDLFMVDLADMLQGSIALPPIAGALKACGKPSLENLKHIASFFRIVRNYQRMQALLDSSPAPSL